MRTVCGILAIIALIICFGSSVNVFLNSSSGNYEQDFESFKTIFCWATLLWFLSAPYWMAPDLFSKSNNKDE